MPLHSFWNTQSLTGYALTGLLLLVLATVFAIVIRRTARRFETHLSDATALHFLSALAQALVYVIAFMVFAHLVPQLRDLGHVLLAGVSIVSVVVGLAAQSTLSNLIAGISLIVYRPVSINDIVQISGPTGTAFIVGQVMSISLGFTTLRDQAGHTISVPNGAMMGDTIIHLSGWPAAATKTS